MSAPLRILIVDDSALIRRMLRSMLESEPSFQVVGEAADGREALQQVARLRPDIITMDVRMPVMDGLETTERLMAYYPTPILVLTASLASYEVDITFKMLGAGALDVMEKPHLTDQAALDRARRDLVRRIKILARVHVVTHLRGRRRSGEPHVEPERPSQPRFAPAPATRMLVRRPRPAAPFPVVVIGASTGGPRVLRQILHGLPAAFAAAVVIVQHIADGFSRGMVEWLAGHCVLPVRLADEGMEIAPGVVLVAPERSDVMVQGEKQVHLNHRPLLLQRPSVDITMQSIAEAFGSSTIGVLLTGMGRDGAIGMQTIFRSGGYTIAQDEASCAIFGMPRAAIELGVVNEVLPPDGIVQALCRYAIARR